MTHDIFLDPGSGANDSQSKLAETWRSVRMDIHSAIGEVALEVGGEPLVKHVQGLEGFTEDSMFPHTDAVEFLEAMDPGSRDRVIDISERIAVDRQDIELAEGPGVANHFPGTRRRAFLRGIDTVFGSLPSSWGRSNR